MFTTPVQAMTSLSLETALAHIRDELQARRNAVDGLQMLSEFLVTVQKQVGFTREDGEPWVAPVSQIYAFPYGATVTHKTITWRSIVPVNMSEPGKSSDWVAEGAPATMADPAVVPAYDPDSGPAESGDLVKVDETVYLSLVSDNRWSPIVFPDVWEAIEFVQNAHGVIHVQGAPYSQPTGAHDAYTLGNEVTHDGGLWRSLWLVNVWEPGTVDGAWERVGDAPDTEPGPLPLDEYPVWEPGISFKPGDPCVDDGILYTAIQAHTSEPGWRPALVPALWKKVG